MSQHPTICCRECGRPLDWHWSKGTWDQGAWIIRCKNAGSFAKHDGCFMCGDVFSADRYDQDFAKHRAMRLIRRAQSGIIYNNPESTIEEWIYEAVRRGIVPADWETWGEVQR